MGVDRCEDRLHYGRRASDISKARELQWLRCGTAAAHDTSINQSAARGDQSSCVGHDPSSDHHHDNQQ